MLSQKWRGVHIINESFAYIFMFGFIYYKRKFKMLSIILKVHKLCQCRVERDIVSDIDIRNDILYALRAYP